MLLLAEPPCAEQLARAGLLIEQTSEEVRYTALLGDCFRRLHHLEYGSQAEVKIDWGMSGIAERGSVQATSLKRRASMA